VAADLRGCKPLTRRSHDAIKASNRKPTRDRWGVLQHPDPYTESHVQINTSKDQRQRALLLLDAIVKTFDTIGVEQKESDDHWNHSVVFVLCGCEFGLWIKEKTKRQEHVLTDEEKRDRQRYRHSFAPKYDYHHTGELIVELTYGISDQTAGFAGRFACFGFWRGMSLWFAGSGRLRAESA
jgi:hypothetical protein